MRSYERQPPFVSDWIDYVDNGLKAILIEIKAGKKQPGNPFEYVDFTMQDLLARAGLTVNDVPMGIEKFVETNERDNKRAMEHLRALKAEIRLHRRFMIGKRGYLTGDILPLDEIQDEVDRFSRAVEYEAKRLRRSLKNREYVALNKEDKYNIGRRFKYLHGNVEKYKFWNGVRRRNIEEELQGHLTAYS